MCGSASFRQYSIWRENIPISRTCHEALIPDIYCVCDDRRKLNITDSLVMNASLSLISYVNNLLPEYLCHNLTLKTPINAELILPSTSTAKPKGFEQRIEITLSVDPSDAIFRAQLTRSARSHIWTVKGEVNRINRYGNQSLCVHERFLKPFCYCL